MKYCAILKKAGDTAATVGNRIAATTAAAAATTTATSGGKVNLKMVVMVVLGFAALLPVLFLHSSTHPHGKGSNNFDEHSIVASFNLPKSLLLVKGNTRLLEADIYYALGFRNIKVVILSMESVGLSDTTVIFALHHLPAPSLIEDTFVSLVIRKWELSLGNASLFGVPYLYEVLKFPGGITVSPDQNTFAAESVQVSFIMTLNRSIRHIDEHFKLMGNELEVGLRLTSNETLYIKLTNSRGSTVSPPTTVETLVVRTVGPPSKSRWAQLARSIEDGVATNLGLSGLIFGNVLNSSVQTYSDS